MARLEKPAGSATVIALDQNGREIPAMHWGTFNDLAPTEAAAAKIAIDDECGMIRVYAEVQCRWAVGLFASVAATATDRIVPAGVWFPIPLYDDIHPASLGISFLRDDGNTGATVVQVSETID